MVHAQNRESLDGDDPSEQERYEPETNDIDLYAPHMISQTEISDYNPERRGTPERTLVSAVLRRSLWDLKGSATEAADALDWFFSTGEFEGGDNHIFSVTQVCEHLELDKSELLARIKKMVSSKERFKAFCFNFAAT